MSYTNTQLEQINDLHADFDTFLAKKDWKNARLVIEQTGDLGYEMEALQMHKTWNTAFLARPVEPPAHVIAPMENFMEDGFNHQEALNNN